MPPKSLLGWAASAGRLRLRETDSAVLLVASGSDLDGGPAIVAIPLESGIEIHKSHISEKTVKK